MLTLHVTALAQWTLALVPRQTKNRRRRRGHRGVVVRHHAHRRRGGCDDDELVKVVLDNRLMRWKSMAIPPPEPLAFGTWSNLAGVGARNPL